MNNPRLILIVCTAAFATACATRDAVSDDQPPRETVRSESGGGIWNMLAEERRKKETRLAADRVRRENLEAQMERGRAAFPPDVQRSLDLWWRQFLTNDPAWLQTRFEWRALGRDAQEVLVENLLIVMVRSLEQNKGHFFQRSRAELFEMPAVSSPYLVAALAHTQGDAVIRAQCAELLGLIGRGALAAVRSAWRGASPDGRRELLAAVAAMGKDGAPESTPFLIEAYGDADDIRMRLRAIEGLGRAGDPEGIPTLLSCLRDSDLSIRKFAAASLGGFSPDRVAEALITALTAAERAAAREPREREVAVNCMRALRTSTGQAFRTSSEWRQWWNRR